MNTPRWMRLWWLGRQIAALLRQMDADMPETERRGLFMRVVDLHQQRAVLRARR